MKKIAFNICYPVKPILTFVLVLSTFFATAQQPTASFIALPLSGCAPLAVTFTDQSAGSPTAWQWDLGNGTLSTQQNPTTTYFNSGLYTISLTVTNANGSNTLTRTQYIKVDDKPIVDFTALNTTGCFPLRTSFSDLSIGGSAAISSWEWDFGDGGLSTAQNPVHNYLVAGNYTVTLKVTNSGGCSKVISRPNYIQVSTGVTVAFTNSAPTQCKPPETINFTDNSTGPGTLSYEWLFGDGSNTFAQNTSHTYLTGGNFTVSLIVQSSLGCIDTLVKPSAIVIRDVTSAITGPATVCQGATANFTNSSTPVPVSSLWNFGDATTSTATNPTKAYATPGTYTITLTNNYGTCSDFVTSQITVLGLPTPDFTATDVTDCKVPFTANFTNLSTGGISWNWDFGDGGTSTQANPSHTYNALGNYNVTLVVTGANGCADSVTKNQFIRIQKPIVAFNGLPQEGCVPFTINPTANVTTVDGILSYLWDFGDGGTSTFANPTHTYIAQGNYTVKLYVTTNDGCTDSSVLVNAVRTGNKSIANFNAVPVGQCVGLPIQFNNLTVPSDRWSWDFGNGIGFSTVQNPSYTYTDTGVFTIRLIAWNNGCADTLTRTNYITALPPVARFTNTFTCANKLQVVFTDQSILPQTWLWNFGDGFTSNAPNPVHVYATYGTYTVTLTVTNGGCSNTRTSTITLFDENANFIISNDTLCKGAITLFQATGVNFANIVSYYWDYGDATTAIGNDQFASHGYATAGTYTVKLIITDTKGCIDSIIKPNAIRVFGPTANFSFAPIAGCRPLNVSFNDLTITDGVHPITQWAWNWGDGNTQNYTTPPFNHTFITNGNYNPILTVTDSYGCTSSLTSATQVFVSKPQANFSTADSLTCVGGNVILTSLSTGIGLTYNWNFGDATTSTTANPVKVYAADGDYTVQLIATDVNGCTDTATKINYIKVHTAKAAFTVNDSISSCNPFEVIFTNTSLYSTSGRWIFGDGTTSTLAQPTHYYSTPGTYIARLAVAGPGGCVDTVNKTIILYPSTANLTYNPLSGCSPLPVNFSVVTPGPVTYLWDFNDGNTLATNNASLIYNYLLPGKFLPKVILTDQTGCQIPVTGVDTIYVIKSIVDFAASDSLLCDGGIITFSDSTINNAPVLSYQWSFGDGGTSNLQNPSHNYTAPGFYTVRLIVTTVNGCSDTAIKNNLIKVVASPVIDIAGIMPICMQNRLTFRGLVVVPDTSKIQWYWNFGNGKTAITQNPQPQLYDTAGNYALRLIVTNSSGCADTVDRTVVVYPLPTIDAGPNVIIGVGSSIAINPTGTPVVDYLWTPATALSCTNCYNTIASPKNTTTYTIKVTDANGCINKDAITVIVLCNNNNVFIPNTFSPNNDGVNDWFYPRGKGLFNIQSMRIFNRWGEMVFQKVNLLPNDPLAGWNGKYNGKAVTTDVYTYIIEIVCENSEILTYKGNITLIQ